MNSGKEIIPVLPLQLKSPITRFCFQTLYMVRTSGLKHMEGLGTRIGTQNNIFHTTTDSPSRATAQLLSSFISTEPLSSSCKPNSFLLHPLVSTSPPETPVSLADNKATEIRWTKDVALPNFFVLFTGCCYYYCSLFCLLKKNMLCSGFYRTFRSHSPKGDSELTLPSESSILWQRYSSCPKQRKI